jgi:SAM-dependent methyltransferase
MSVLDFIMRQPLVYRLWMAPWAGKKFAPVASRNDMTRVRRVLDVGCGPGTNAEYFSGVSYLGVDLNPQYIRDAERRYGNGERRFLAVDAAKFQAAPEARFDFILVNSFFHHVNDEIARGILRNLSRLLTDDGAVHILDLVLPEKMSAAKVLALADRGEYPRSLEKWRELFSEFLKPECFEPYDLGMLGIPLWKMAYFKGRSPL